jgi:hypothetical protein
LNPAIPTPIWGFLSSAHYLLGLLQYLYLSLDLVGQIWHLRLVCSHPVSWLKQMTLGSSLMQHIVTTPKECPAALKFSSFINFRKFRRIADSIKDCASRSASYLSLLHVLPTRTQTIPESGSSSIITRKVIQDECTLPIRLLEHGFF